MSNKQLGQCPYCGSEDLNYKDHSHVGTSLIYRCRCNTCGKCFTEEYEVTFVGFFDEYGKEM